MKKKVSNQEWESPVDPDARIMKMKDGTTHLAYKAEHVVDLETGAILSAEIHQATESDSGTLEASLRTAQTHLKEAGTYRYIEEVAADKGYHKGEALQACGLLNGLGIRTYVPEPESKYERKWKNKSPLEREAVDNNRRRMKRLCKRAATDQSREGDVRLSMRDQQRGTNSASRPRSANKR